MGSRLFEAVLLGLRVQTRYILTLRSSAKAKLNRECYCISLTHLPHTTDPTTVINVLCTKILTNEEKTNAIKINYGSGYVLA